MGKMNLLISINCPTHESFLNLTSHSCFCLACLKLCSFSGFKTGLDCVIFIRLDVTYWPLTKPSLRDAPVKISGSSQVVKRKCVGVMKWYMQMPTSRYGQSQTWVSLGLQQSVESADREPCPMGGPSGPLAGTGWVHLVWREGTNLWS